MLKGIDISSYQHNLTDFSGVDFVICKATEGIGYTDRTCDTLYQRAKAQGKLLGVYHFARPDLGNTPEGEAEWFVANIKGYLKEALLVLDWEAGNTRNVAYAKKFLDKVHELTGIKPLIYASTSVINSNDWSSVVAADYGLWVAQYGADNGQPGQKPVVNHWNFYAMWQYSSRGRIPGYGAEVDVNEFYGDAKTWKAYAGSTPGSQEGQNKPVSQPDRKSIQEVAQEVLKGVYGNGADRKAKLTEAGYNYDEVQAKVNELLNTPKRKSVEEIAKEVIAGKWGNGADRHNKLQAAGYNAAEVQAKVNELCGASRTHTVARGEYLELIAKKYGTSVTEILRKNPGIKNKNVIYPGQVINI